MFRKLKTDCSLKDSEDLHQYDDRALPVFEIVFKESGLEDVNLNLVYTRFLIIWFLIFKGLI